MAFGVEVHNVLVFDPPQVQPRPIPVASIYARLGGSEAAAGGSQLCRCCNTGKVMCSLRWDELCGDFEV